MFTAFPINLIYIVPLLSDQPALSGHYSKSQGWPLNRGLYTDQMELELELELELVFA